MLCSDVDGEAISLFSRDMSELLDEHNAFHHRGAAAPHGADLLLRTVSGRAPWASAVLLEAALQTERQGETRKGGNTGGAEHWRGDHWQGELWKSIGQARA